LSFRPLAAALLALTLALPAPAQEVMEPDLGPDYPPKMGEVTGTLNGRAVKWETFDFSVGAFDASAWADHYQGKATFRINGYLPGKPDAERMQLRVGTEWGAALTTGPAPGAVEVAILRGGDPEGPRLTSAGQTARVVIDSIGPAREDSYSRRVTGTVTARLCPVDWPFRHCADLELRFDTDVQMGTTVPVK